MNPSKPAPSPHPRKNLGISRDAETTRQRILEAARIHFSQNSFDGVGVRDIARDASVDAALISRYFGSKEGLFREVASQAFGTEDFLESGLAAMPDKIAALLLGNIDDEAWRKGYNPLRLLLCSIGSPVAGPILSEYLDRDFIEPLASALHGHHSRERGAAVAAHVLGFAIIRIALATRKDQLLRIEALRPLLKNAVAEMIST